MLDLCDAALLYSLDLTPLSLAGAWEQMAADRQTPPTWQLARQLIRQGIAGIRVPSFAHNSQPNDINLIFWSWGDALPHQVLVIDDHDRLQPAP
jgi:RES domain-containing protein